MLFREAVDKFLSGLPLYLGYAWMLWDSQRQGWHDKTAGTLVLDECAFKPAWEATRQNALAGAWQEAEGSGCLVFWPDGAVTAPGESGLPVRGRYRWVDPARIEVDLGGPFGPRVFRVELSGSKLVLVSSDGRRTRYRRTAASGEFFPPGEGSMPVV